MAGAATVGITEKPYLARNAQALQSVYTDRASPADWQALIPQLSPVQKLIHLSARWVGDDIENLETRLFNELRITYRDGLQQELNKWGCAGVSAVVPAAGAELSAIRDRVRFAANSVGNTYNLELAREIIRIGEDTPTANRHTYAFRLYNRQGSWDSAYWVAKAKQIAQIETMTVVNAAVADFYSRNGDLLQPQAIVVPFTAAESVCAQIVSENPYRTVDEVYRKWTLPVHIGCLVPGQSIRTPAGQVKIEEAEVGDLVVTPKGSCRVTEVHQRNVQELIYLLEVGEQVVRLTGDHPVKTRNGWIATKDLNASDMVLVAFSESSRQMHDRTNFEFKPITAITTEEYDGPVVNLTVDKEECYVVNGFVLHNCPHRAEARSDKRLAPETCRMLWAGQ